MKDLFKASIFLGTLMFLMACKLASQVAPSPVPSPTATLTPTIALIPSQTATIEPTPTPTYNPPTLVPTIDPTSVPELLRGALSVQTMEDANGYGIRRITGWEYGFRQSPCCGYQWLDSDHLLLYPRTGEGMQPFMDGSRKADLSSQPVIINLENGYFWLPWSNIPTSIHVAPELGIVFQQEAYGSATGPTKEAIFTYTFDGEEIARYWGKILGVSPKGTKVLVDDDTIIDLRNDKIIDLAWYMDYDLERSSNLYWSADEIRVYRCCFYYADLRTGKSYNLEWSDLRGVDGKSIPFSLRSPHVGGQWVRNDTYFFPKWDYWSFAGDPTMIFSPAEKKYSVIELPGASAINPETTSYTISPDGMYVWIEGFSEVDGYHDFMVNLTTFETTSYDIPINGFFWSPDSKFGWIDELDSNNAYVLSLARKKIMPFPVNPRYENEAVWHPKEPVLAYTSENDQTLVFLNAKDMSIVGWKLPVSISGFYWSADGDHVVFTANDKSLWQVDYPKFQTFEQLTGPMASISNISWSPDGQYLAFIGGSDIYIVDTMK